MLSDNERATFREIEETLVEAPAFRWSLRNTNATPSPSRRRQIAAGFASLVGLLAVFLIAVGSYGSVLLFIAAAIALGMAHRIEIAIKRAD